MSTVVSSIPEAVRKTKYDYTKWFDGDAHRLVRGEDFDATVASFRGALYSRKAVLNKRDPENQIGLTVRFRTEQGQVIAYVQKTEPKVKKTETPKPAAKTSEKKVSPPSKK